MINYKCSFYYSSAWIARALDKIDPERPRQLVLAIHPKVCLKRKNGQKYWQSEFLKGNKKRQQIIYYAHPPCPPHGFTLFNLDLTSLNMERRGGLLAIQGDVRELFEMGRHTLFCGTRPWHI